LWLSERKPGNFSHHCGHAVTIGKGPHTHQ
jgi:hypothetical protein